MHPLSPSKVQRLKHRCVDGGIGEDPNRDRKKKSDPVDKKDDVDEEDVNLYIESIEDENHPPEMLAKIEVNLTETCR